MILLEQYREHEVKYLMQGENARLFTVTLTGNELEKLISHSLNLHGTRGSVVNESSLYVSSGFEMQVRKTDDGYLLEGLTIEGKPMDMEKTYSIGIISGEYYFAPTLFSDCGITDYALSELYPKQLLADRLIKEGKQLAAPTDYITLVK